LIDIAWNSGKGINSGASGNLSGNVSSGTSFLTSNVNSIFTTTNNLDSQSVYLSASNIINQ
jgi:hypothetical protein